MDNNSRPSSHPIRMKIKLVGFVIAVLVAVFYTGWELMRIYPSGRGAGPGDEQTVTIPSGAGPKRIAQIMQNAGAISSPAKFELWLKLSKVLPSIKAGTFVINDAMSPDELIETLRGRAISNGIRITIPEGYRLSQIEDIVTRDGWLSSDDFRKAATDGEMLARLGIEADSFEGYLFPDTYFFDDRTSAEDLISRMYDNFVRKTASLSIPAERRHALVTLASIVEAETTVAAEASMIAGVYVNRLNPETFPLGILQADPTVAYGCDPYAYPQAPSCKTFKGRLGRRQLDDSQNPYNTYQHKGVPPGPICNPGMNALRAAAAPDSVPYLYFVVEDKGRHHFSSTYADHQKAVRRYRERQRRQSASKRNVTTPGYVRHKPAQ